MLEVAQVSGKRVLMKIRPDQPFYPSECAWCGEKVHPEDLTDFRVYFIPPDAPPIPEGDEDTLQWYLEGFEEHEYVYSMCGECIEHTHFDLRSLDLWDEVLSGLRGKLKPEYLGWRVFGRVEWLRRDVTELGTVLVKEWGCELRGVVEEKDLRIWGVH